MFLNSLGNIFASREENFISATMFPRVGKHLRKHRESQMFPQQCFLVCPGLYFAGQNKLNLVISHLIGR
jgi:hypothetical protein